jgi:phosphatidate cytidylyltransferase
MINLYSFDKTFDIHLHDTKFVFTSTFMPIVIIASIWINDTMAYIVGSLIGKTPLSKISPKKTWEGTIGGILLCIGLVGFVLTGMIFPVNELALDIFVALIAGLAAIFGTLGDLFESKLKRMAGVKDSGHIMPGHGGFLDRFDSLLLATPAVWIFVQLFR